ncbi:hypothetical protein K504DRAFT_508692 [Pleomassaria siparia CBS 279.74]|uniref:Uncharacterized protein n=1 Tax=Pleomassaria siparia CBS 279.74 TaxID=1314801 RepID=A0A6G1JQ33_9PLEO|nr:hypothetical protein K504DRAFT_508692 [Pleomassaria siparia CBS 279.74]
MSELFTVRPIFQTPRSGFYASSIQSIERGSTRRRSLFIQSDDTLNFLLQACADKKAPVLPVAEHATVALGAEIYPLLYETRRRATWSSVGSRGGLPRQKHVQVMLMVVARKASPEAGNGDNVDGRMASNNSKSDNKGERDDARHGDRDDNSVDVNKNMDDQNNPECTSEEDHTLSEYGDMQDVEAVQDDQDAQDSQYMQDM